MRRPAHLLAQSPIHHKFLFSNSPLSPPLLLCRRVFVQQRRRELPFAPLTRRCLIGRPRIPFSRAGLHFSMRVFSSTRDHFFLPPLGPPSCPFVFYNSSFMDTYDVMASVVRGVSLRPAFLVRVFFCFFPATSLCVPSSLLADHL